MTKLAPQHDKIFQKLNAIWKKNSEQLFLVGGAVRSLLANEPTKDLDFTTSASPEKMKQMLKANKLPVYELGERFFTIGTKIDDMVVEITTFRSEKYTEGSRKPAVVMGTKLEEDLERRDFTINAMAMDAAGQLFDPFNGASDFRNKILRTPLNARIILREDPLRSLRAARFIGKYNLKPDRLLAKALAESAPLIKTLSAERVSQELNYIVTLPDPLPALHALHQYDLLYQFIPEFIGSNVSQETPWHTYTILEHCFRTCAAMPNNLEARLAGLLHDIGKTGTKRWVPAKKRCQYIGHAELGAKQVRVLMRRLRYPEQFTDRIAEIVAKHMIFHLLPKPYSEKTLKKAIRQTHHLQPVISQLSWADVFAGNPKLSRDGCAQEERIKKDIDRLVAAQNKQIFFTPAIDGDDIMRILNLKPGREVAFAKKKIYKAIEDEVVPNDKAKLTRFLSGNWKSWSDQLDKYIKYKDLERSELNLG